MFEVHSRAELIASGMSKRMIAAAVADGRLVRARKGHYVAGDACDDLLHAARVGGRLGCVSLLRPLGVFVFDKSVVHVHMERGDSRMRGTHGSPLAGRTVRKDAVLHWQRMVGAPTSGSVHIVDALIQAVRCQEPRYAIATLDSALNRRVVTDAELDDVFAALPARYRVLRRFLNGRAEAGTETLVRLVLLRMGCAVELQRKFRGVGRVDLVVDGWLVIECDSKEFHGDWAQQRKDYRRDLALAALGYCVLRLTA